MDFVPSDKVQPATAPTTAPIRPSHASETHPLSSNVSDERRRGKDSSRRVDFTYPTSHRFTKSWCRPIDRFDPPTGHLPRTLSTGDTLGSGNLPSKGESLMRFYNVTHKYYCGIDLHARNMYTCVLDQEGNALLHRDLPTDPNVFLKAIAPFREKLAVAVECIFTWYWLADLCAREGIDFVLGHALYMKAIHGGKAKNDRIDALKIATPLRGGMFPQAHVYPPEMRSTRDLLRRRLKLVPKEATSSLTSRTLTTNTISRHRKPASTIDAIERVSPRSSPTPPFSRASHRTSSSLATTIFSSRTSSSFSHERSKSMTRVTPSDSAPFPASARCSP